MSKKSYYFVGVGQAGGNIGWLAEKLGYGAAYINSSQQDLDTIVGGKHKYLIKGGIGCSKDRNLSKQLFVADLGNIAEFIRVKIVNTVRTIFVVYATSGGTGSGGGNGFVKMLKAAFPQLNICPIIILPSSSETFKAQFNACECLKELLKLDMSNACFVLDNNKREDKIAINHHFIGALDKFLSIPESDKSILGNIDEAEINTVLSAHNMAVLSTTDGDKTNIADILKDIKGNVFADIEKDNIIQYAAVSCSNRNIKMADLASELQNSFGTLVDSYFTYNKRQCSITCLSGLSYPMTRIGEIFKTVKQHKEQVINARQNQNTFDFGTDLDDIFTTPKPKNENKVRSREDILNEFLDNN